MKKYEFVDLVSLSNGVLSEFERLVNTKPNKLAVAKTVAPTTDVAAIGNHISDVVVGSNDAVDGDEVTFAISDLATFACQPFCGYCDRSVSLETQCGDGDETVFSCAVSDTGTSGAAESLLLSVTYRQCQSTILFL